MKKLLVRLIREEAGQDLIEYALLAGFISLVAVTTIITVGESTDAVYGRIDGQLQNVP